MTQFEKKSFSFGYGDSEKYAKNHSSIFRKKPKKDKPQITQIKKIEKEDYDGTK